MLKNRYQVILCIFIINFAPLKSQILTLDEVLENITLNNPQLKMYDADIQSMDVASAGAKSWMPPQVQAGFFMTPYNPSFWKADGAFAGMGNFMVGATQMIPNPKKQMADFNYMNAMSSVEKENKNYTLNQLYALAKTNYHEWMIISKKVKIANENLQLLAYMIKSMEIRYQYNMDKLPTYYKAKSNYSSLESMIVMLKNDISQKMIVLNTLMARDKNFTFEVDSTYRFIDFNNEASDTTFLAKSRSDIKAIEKTININQLKIEVENTRLLPDFGVRYDHMFAFGQQPQQFTLMGMVNIPMSWSTKMNKANIHSFQIKNESLYWQKQMVLNEASGMIKAMKTELKFLKDQYQISENSIIPALRKNYETALLAWQNNTGDLFQVLDAWESLNMAQLDTLDKLQRILGTQVEIEKQMEIK
mgnify:FL=1